MRTSSRTALAALLLIAGWLFLSQPSELPLTPACEATGVTNRLRAMIQGERFWHSVGVIMERQQRDATNGSALTPCRAVIFERAGMRVEGGAR